MKYLHGNLTREEVVKNLSPMSRDKKFEEMWEYYQELVRANGHQGITELLISHKSLEAKLEAMNEAKPIEDALATKPSQDDVKERIESK